MERVVKIGFRWASEACFITGGSSGMEISRLSAADSAIRDSWARAMFCQAADAMNPMRKEKIMAGTDTNGRAMGNSTNLAKTGRRKTKK